MSNFKQDGLWAIRPVSLYPLLWNFLSRLQDSGRVTGGFCCSQRQLHPEHFQKLRSFRVQLSPHKTPPLCGRSHLGPLMVAGCEGDSSVRYRMSERMDPGSAAKLHPAWFFFWSLAVDTLVRSLSTSSHLFDVVTAGYQ